MCIRDREIDAVATALVEAFISNLEGKGDLEKAAATIAQEMCIRDRSMTAHLC